MPRSTKLLARSSLALALVLASACRSDATTPTADAPASRAEAKATADEPPPPEQLPDAAKLLAEHVAASGGAEQIAKFESIHVVGTVAVEAHELAGTMELWWQKDGKVYLEQDVEGVGKSRFGYDGETIWLDDPVAGLRELEGREAASYLQSSLMFLGHDWPRHFRAAKTVAKHQHDDGAVWEIELESERGPNVTVELGVDDKMIRSMTSKQATLLGELPIEVRNDRFETVEGYEFAFHRRSSVAGLLELDETITSFEVNVPVDPAVFAFPHEREVVELDPRKQEPVTVEKSPEPSKEPPKK